MKEAIHVILDIWQADYHVQEDNKYDYMVRKVRMKNLKRHGKVIKNQAMTQKITDLHAITVLLAHGD